jgi:arylsulfatase A-like enzyme
MPPPHIVLTVLDDLGYHGVGYRNPALKTPTIDRLASHGVKLESFYTAKLCGPSRSSLLTGRAPHTLQASVDNLAHYWFEEGLHASYVLLPEALRRRGYDTVGVGKWHCGFSHPSYLPTNRGFGSWFGFLGGCEDHVTQRICGAEPCSAKFPGVGHPVDLHRDGRPALGENGTADGFSHNCLRFGAAAVESIERFARRTRAHMSPARLFLYLALQDPHAPYQTPARFEALYAHAQPLRNIWSGMVSAIDETMANVTAALRRRGMWHDTFLVTVSDNGSPVGGWGAGGSNHPLKGGKSSSWEGGIRTVAFLSGGWLPTSRWGSSLDGLVHISDLYATLCSLASSGGVGEDGSSPRGAATAASHAARCLANSGPAPADSFDLLPYWLGRTQRSPREEMVHECCSTKLAVMRYQHLKLVASPLDQAHHFGAFSPSLNNSVLQAESAFQSALRVELLRLDDQVGLGKLSRADAGRRKAQLRQAHGPSPVAAVHEQVARWFALTECSWKAPCLYNISSDPEERVDLAPAQPGLVASLKARLSRHVYSDFYYWRNRSRFGINKTPTKNKTAFCRAAFKNGGFLMPWEGKRY